MSRKPSLEEVFCLEGALQEAILIGESSDVGRRQLVMTGEGKVSGKLTGKGMPGGVDCQIIRPDGITEVSARYGIQLDDGNTFLVINEGIRRVPADTLEHVKAGGIPDPMRAYFVTTPRFEVYSEKLQWLKESVFVCVAEREKTSVTLRFYRVNLE